MLSMLLLLLLLLYHFTLSSMSRKRAKHNKNKKKTLKILLKDKLAFLSFFYFIWEGGCKLRVASFQTEFHKNFGDFFQQKTSSNMS